MLKPVALFRRPVVVLSASGLVLAACQKDEPPPPPATPAASGEPEPSAAAAPLVTPTLGRAEILSAIARAANAYATGTPPEGQDPLVGRTFSVQLAFGCSGPETPPNGTSGDGKGAWSWDEARETIRLRLTPGDWTGSALISGATEGQWEAVEGFWITRPWLTAEGCPAVRADPLAAGPATASPEAAGLAAVFETGSSRLGRRNGRAYTYTVRPTGDEPVTPPRNGYRVRLEGRISAFPSGRAVHCRAAGPDQRPVCVAAVQMDRVAFMTAEGATLGEWRPG